MNKTPLRIVFFVWHLGIGGAQTQISLLADRMAQAGHDILVVTAYPGGQNWEQLRDRRQVRLQALFEHRLIGAARVLAGLRVTWGVLRLRRLLSRERSVLVKSTLHLNNLIAWLATRKMPNAKLVWWMQASDSLENREATLAYHICRRVSASVPLLIANSKAGLAHHEREGFRSQRHVVIHNGFDTEYFRPDTEARQRVRAEWGVIEGEKLIGLVGRIDPIKGHPIFLEAASGLSAERVGLRFVLVGDGAERYKGQLRRMATELDMESRIIWAGPRSDMPAIYNALDILASPSQSEGFSNVIGEAMACGVPCVVTDVGDSAWIVGDTGAVISPNSMVELVRGLGTLLELSGADRRSVSENARRRIQRYFSSDNLFHQTEDTLRMLNMAP